MVFDQQAEPMVGGLDCVNVFRSVMISDQKMELVQHQGSSGRSRYKEGALRLSTL